MIKSDAGLPLPTDVCCWCRHIYPQTADYFKTVHAGGVGRAAEEAEDREREKSEWKSKLVVDDPVLRATLPIKPKPSQTDRMTHLLQVIYCVDYLHVCMVAIREGPSSA